MARSERVVVVIGEDPRASHRANEALRIALGVVAGDSDVSVVLTGPAIHLLDEDTDDLVDGDDIAKFRASLKKLGIAFHVAADTIPTGPGGNVDGLTVIPATPGDIAALMTRATRYLIF